MYECYDCGDNFSFYGDCPSCSSENIGATSSYDYNDDDDDYEDDVFEDDEEISDALRDVDKRERG